MLYRATLEESKTSFNVKVSADGTVIWFLAVKYRIPCEMTVKYFPWDRHKCPLVFGSWTLSDDDLKMETWQLSITDLPFGDNIWKIESEYKTDVMQFDVGVNKSENYTVLTGYFTFDRKAGFLTYFIVFPAILMSFLTLIALYLPANIPEKITIGKYFTNSIFFVYLFQ